MEKFDDEIARLQQELNEVSARKKDALHTFETVTKIFFRMKSSILTKEKLNGLKDQFEDVQSQLRDTSVRVKEGRLKIAEEYGSHLGREFLDPFKISDLSELVRQGRHPV